MRRWAEFAHGSPMYRHYALLIAETPKLLDVVARIEHTPQTNVLFAAVQYLMAKGAGEELAAFYPNLTESPRPLGDIDRPFIDFVSGHADEIVEIGRTRYTQTNECRRCGVLLPAIWEWDQDSFHLIDIGTSAGLNLAMDKYRYRWDGVEWGPDSPVVVDVELRGRNPVSRPIQVLGRHGLDLNPIDPRDPDQRLWLEALIWPEHTGRRERLLAALEICDEVELSFVPGDASVTLGPVLEALPRGEPAVVLNSFSFNQLKEEQRRAIEDVVSDARNERPIHRVSMEVFSSSSEWAEVRVDSGDGWWDFGHAHPHAEWAEFYARP